MASLGQVESLFGGLEQALRRTMVEVFRAFLPNLRLGRIEHQTKSENFQAYYVVSTTAPSTSEFSVEHGMGVTPYAAVPCLALDSSGGRLVDLEVSRVADSQRVYLKAAAGSTNQLFGLLLE